MKTRTLTGRSVGLAVALLAAPLSVQTAGAVPLPLDIFHNNKDAGALAALDKSVAFYRSQPSFSVTGRETLRVDGEVARRVAFEFGAQAPARAFLKVTLLDANGNAAELLLARLLGAETYTVQEENQPLQTTPIRSAQERETALINLTNALPSLGLSLGAFALQTNPARTPFATSATLARGENNTDIVTTVNQIEGEPITVNARYTLDSASGALKQLETHLELKNTRVVTTTEFDAPVFNWRGSQDATDAQVYNWDNFTATDAQTNAQARARQRSLAICARYVSIYAATGRGLAKLSAA